MNAIVKTALTTIQASLAGGFLICCQTVRGTTLRRCAKTCLHAKWAINADMLIAKKSVVIIRLSIKQVTAFIRPKKKGNAPNGASAAVSLMQKKTKELKESSLNFLQKPIKLSCAK